MKFHYQLCFYSTLANKKYPKLLYSGKGRAYSVTSDYRRATHFSDLLFAIECGRTHLSRLYPYYDAFEVVEITL